MMTVYDENFHRFVLLALMSAAHACALEAC